jgi:hypothetical protein
MKDPRQLEADQQAAEKATTRRFDALDTQKAMQDIKEKDFPDEWLEEIEQSEATK